MQDTRLAVAGQTGVTRARNIPRRLLISGLLAHDRAEVPALGTSAGWLYTAKPAHNNA
jgi:hypothetical protein